ncbi:hypothetical protein GCM10023149_25880 [Mucilaginibacter gynuensis]|uniref:Uncharacterized protein n=1 Tax=Mucilaginibacter gynuensis TaxID=1302236 RepID=A0ABP8GHR9_9SPHI
MQQRFTDENKLMSDFFGEVWVHCSTCNKKAIATVSFETQTASLHCTQCGLYKRISTEITLLGSKGHWQLPANRYFDAELWLMMPFKAEVFFAYNGQHLAYLEKYISATLREHKDRTHFTLLEKLPKFYHEAKNRKGLLKIIEKLSKK